MVTILIHTWIFSPLWNFHYLTCSRCSPFFSGFSGFPPSQALGEDRGGGRHVCLNSFSLDNLKKCCSYKEGCQTKSKWTILSKYVTDWNAVAVIQRNWLSRFQFLLNLDIPTTLEIKTRKDTGDRKIKTLDCYISS